MFTYILDKSQIMQTLPVLLGGGGVESDPMIIARLLKAVLHNRSSSPLVSVCNVFKEHSSIFCYYGSSFLFWRSKFF